MSPRPPRRILKLRCPACGGRLAVEKTTLSKSGRYLRRRKCRSCRKGYWTEERFVKPAQGDRGLKPHPRIEWKPYEVGIKAKVPTAETKPPAPAPVRNQDWREELSESLRDEGVADDPDPDDA